MTIKVYISGICGSHEVRKQQQRVLFILQGMPIDLQIIDITEPGKDEELILMQETAKKHDKKTQLPPQIFNDNEYCGDYADFELANDDDDIMKFLKLESGPSKAEILQSGGTITQNGIESHDKDASETNNTNQVSDDSNVINSEKKDIDVEKVETTGNETSNAEESVEQNVPKEEDKEKKSAEEEESEEESE